MLIDLKNFLDLAIHFIRYVHSKSIKMLSLYYHELMEKVKKNRGRKYFMIDDYVLDKVLGNIKEIIGFEKFDETKIYNTHDRLPDDTTFRNILIFNGICYKRRRTISSANIFRRSMISSLKDWQWPCKA